MSGDRAKVNVDTTADHAELYKPPRQDKTPTLGDALGNRLRGFWGMKRIHGKTRLC